MFEDVEQQKRKLLATKKESSSNGPLLAATWHATIHPASALAVEVSGIECFECSSFSPGMGLHPVRTRLTLFVGIKTQRLKLFVLRRSRKRMETAARLRHYGRSAALLIFTRPDRHEHELLQGYHTDPSLHSGDATSGSKCPERKLFPLQLGARVYLAT